MTNKNRKMTKNKIIAVLSISLFIITGYLLISQSTLLTQTFIEENTFPAGTFIAWTCLLSLQLSVYYGFSKIQTSKSLFYLVLNYLLIITISLAFFWGVIGYTLSGNWAFNFNNTDQFMGSQEASFWFWRLIYLLLIIPILSTAVILIHEFILKSSKTKR